METQKVIRLRSSEKQPIFYLVLERNEVKLTDANMRSLSRIASGSRWDDVRSFVYRIASMLGEEKYY